jgi:hypothetical protein
MAPAAALPSNELVLGRYRPLRPLGSGGSGSVWLTRDEQTGLDVALKIVPREAKAGARAEREAAAAARLRHPACPRVYALARDSQHVYIAYEYVPGLTMREALRAGRLVDAAAIEAAAQVCDALAHAHAHGIVHRDVKPSNILLAEGPTVAVKLLDFGLARMDEAETLTAAGDVPGTLAYVSPERLTGGEALPASDVWAVGVLLWEALVGMHPFWNGSLLETARAIPRGAPPLSEHRPDLPKRLAAAVDLALALRPADRPTAAQLAQALRRTARRPPQRAARPPRRPRPALPSGRPLAWARMRAVPAVLAATFAGGSAALLPFFPSGWWAPIALLAACVTLVSERAGLALALAVPILPLGNIGLGLAFAYSALAVAWLALAWREPRGAFVFALGPLLAPLGALGLLPLAAGLRSGWRRGLQTAAGVLIAALVAGLRHDALPLTGDLPPLGLGVAGGRDPLDVAGSLWRALAAHPGIGLEAAALALVAVLVPHARHFGRWGAAGLGALMLAVTLLPTHTAVWPLVLAAWAVSLAVAARAEH